MENQCANVLIVSEINKRQYAELSENFWETAPSKSGYTYAAGAVFAALLHLCKKVGTRHLFDANMPLVAVSGVPRKALDKALAWLDESGFISYQAGKNATVKPKIVLIIEGQICPSDGQLATISGPSTSQQAEKTSETPPRTPPIKETPSSSSQTDEEAELQDLIEKFKKENPGAYPDSFYGDFVDYSLQPSRKDPSKSFWSVQPKGSDMLKNLGRQLEIRWGYRKHVFLIGRGDVNADSQAGLFVTRKTPAFHEFQ